ncbi:phenolic glucoside malonyltransferase 1-like [Lolium perenne]|uniref:phenolic glucoside malonyltransferase 1-like n=1 Tax=Lolium perenne TaxID=4522 RepID=UPI003A98EC12
MPPILELSVLESAVAAPSPPAPETACSLPLNFFDVFCLNSPPVERVFFYRLTPGTGDDITTILSNLKSSLSKALGVFYPLADRLRLTPGTDDRYELHYQPGDGVTFTVAEYDGDVDELAEDETRREVAKILPLVPPLQVGVGPVLTVQATVLRGGRGLAVSLALHHAACDGASSTRFLHTWAAAAGTGTGAPPATVMDRTLVDDPSGGRPLYKLRSTDEMEYVKMADDQLVATFTLSKEDVQRVKDAVGAAAGARPPRCTSLVATFGFIWLSYQRAKDDAASNGGETYFSCPIDQRSRMKPDPIPDEYFGNCVGAAMQAAPKNQLAAAGSDGLLAACTAVAAAIERAVRELGSPEKMALWVERIREARASGGGVLSVAESPRFRVYDVDFGFGRPAKVEIVSVARTGAMAVAESRQSSGGMEVGMSLPPAGMQRFQTCFHEAIKWLHQQ